MSSLSGNLKDEFYYINTKTSKIEIKDFLNNELNCNDFIRSLSNMGSVMKSLFQDFYSTTDCCSTVYCVKKLFNPVIDGKSQTGFHDTMCSDKYNFFLFETSEPYHTFVCVNIDSRIYIIQSYASKYTLKITDITDSLDRFDTLNTESYNFLFDTTIKSDIEFTLTMKYGKFNKLPCLKTLIENF